MMRKKKRDYAARPTSFFLNTLETRYSTLLNDALNIKPRYAPLPPTNHEAATQNFTSGVTV